MTMPKYDICIIGAGPAGLACLSAIKNHYSLDSMNDGQVHRAATCMHRGSIQEKSVCVIDPSPDWMTQWKNQFDALNIRFLRSPALAHPNMFEKNALLAYAVENDREDELLESGCSDLKPLQGLGETQIGLWKLPSTQLFADFCQDLATQIKHDYVQGSVVDVYKEEDEESFQVVLKDGTSIESDTVILAVGPVGRPIVPHGVEHAPHLYQWTALHTLPPTARNVLVIGGGLTAVQSVQCVLYQNPKSRCVLCSRRDLVERHFDLNVDWFDRRKSTKCMSDFYHLPIDERLRLIKESRGGGSVPPIYIQDIRRLESMGRLRVKNGNVKYLWTRASHGQSKITAVSIAGKIYEFDAIVLACGIHHDCTQNPLVQNLVSRWPIDIIGGLPSITEDLKWTTDKLFVVGGLGALNIGPDGGNLMGIRRAAQTVANSLDCRCWMRETDVLSNRFDAFLLDDETDSSDDDSEA